jgi:hypothetical protein
MRLLTKGLFIRVSIFLVVIGITVVSYFAGREAGISYGYNRGYLFGYFACRQSEIMTNSNSPGEIHIPLKQFDQENEIFRANEKRYQLSSFNDRYLDSTVVGYDNFVFHYKTTEQ